MKSNRHIETPILEDADLREYLVFMREKWLVQLVDGVHREESLLRRRMIDALLKHKPASVKEFYDMIPPFLVQGTDKRHLALALPRVLAELNRLGKRL